MLLYSYVNYSKILALGRTECDRCDYPSTTSESDDVSMDEAADSLKSWAHRVSKRSDRKGKHKGWVIDTDEDVAKLGNLLCGTSKKRSAKALRRVQEDADIDALAGLVEWKSTTANSVARASCKVWAMVDSGSFVTIANCAQAFSGHTVQPSAGSKSGVKYSNASGGDIPNRGEVVITHRTEDGTEIDIPFQDGDVQVPIISVKDFVHKGSVVKFKRNGGTIRLPGGTILRFLEKCGVYFICLNIVSGRGINDSCHETVEPDQAMLTGLVDNTGVPPPPRPHPDPRCERRRSGFIRPVP